MREIMRLLTASGMDCACGPVLLDRACGPVFVALGCFSGFGSSVTVFASVSGGFLAIFFRFEAGSKGKRWLGGSEDIFFV
jgi:uncharacterized RDD family membrane protein YckC